jgi:hypothetical protein
VFDHRLDVLLFLLSTVLPLDVFCRATAEVVGSVLFRDDVSTAGPGTADLCGKAPNFRLDLRPLDPVGPSLQLLSPLLEGDDSGIRGKRIVKPTLIRDDSVIHSFRSLIYANRKTRFRQVSIPSPDIVAGTVA